MSCAAIFAMVALNFGCADPNKKPADDPVKNEDPIVEQTKAVTSEAELIEMGTELFEEITAYFEAFAKPEGPVASMRSAEDPDVTAVMEFVGKIMEAVEKAKSEMKFELTDASIDLKNLSAEKVLKILDSFVKTIEPDESIDNGLEALAEELEIAFGVKITVADLKAKLNECVTVTKLKFKGNLTAEPVLLYEKKYGGLVENSYLTVNMADVEEAAGIDIQKLSDLLGFLTGSEKAFPVKNISLEESANIKKFAATALIRDSFITDPEETPYENINEEAYIDIEDSVIDGKVSVKTAFDFATTKSKYAGNLSLSFDLTSTTENIQKFIKDSEEDYANEAEEMNAMFADLNLFGSVTVKVTDDKAKGTFNHTYKLGDLIKKIMESMPEPEEPFN